MAYRDPVPTPAQSCEYTPAELALYGEALRSMAAPHIRHLIPDSMSEGSDIAQNIEPLPFDIEAYPEQHPDKAHVDGYNLALDTTNAIAEVFQPGYTSERQRLLSDPTTMRNIARMRQLVDEDKNALLMFRHADVKDIVFGTLMVRDLMSIQTGRPDDPYPTDLVVSKMATVLPGAVELLRQFCDTVYYTIPQTDTATKATSGIDPRIIKSMNDLAMLRMYKKLLSGGSVVGIAPTGTTRQTDDIELFPGADKLLTTATGPSAKRKRLVNYLVRVDARMGAQFEVVVGEPNLHESIDSVLALLRQEAPYTRQLDAGLGAAAVTDAIVEQSLTSMRNRF